MKYNSDKVEDEILLEVAKKMCVAARTAPKACGQDSIETLVIDGEEQQALIKAMKTHSKENKQAFFERDAKNLENCACVFLISVHSAPTALPKCGICGYDDCNESIKNKSHCTFKITDLGIALGSAVSIAADNRIDNRILYSAGKAALKLNFFPKDCKVCYAVGLSAKGKNVFFDRQ